MHLVLSLPGLLTQLPDDDARAPSLARLLALAGPPMREPDGIDALLAAHYGIEHASGADCPLAPVRLASLGVDPGNAFWLAADPVTLVAGRDDVRLLGAVRDIDATDAAALVQTLNAHFAGDRIEFMAPRADAWFVRSPERFELRTHPFELVTGRMLRELLPSGRDAAIWRRWQSEIQMLLHEHPVNAARERDGKAPVNSVWLHEGGTRPTPVASLRDAIDTFAGDGIALALASHVGRAARAVPDTLAPILGGSRRAAITVVVPKQSRDLDAFENAWARPAWEALASGKLDAVTLLAHGAGGGWSWTAHRPRGWRKMALRFARHDLASLLAAARASP